MKAPKILLDGNTKQWIVFDNPHIVYGCMVKEIIVRDVLDSKKNRKKIKKYLQKKHNQ